MQLPAENPNPHNIPYRRARFKMSALFHTLYGYHAWANEELFEKLATCDPAHYQAELHTALRLLNHAFVVTRIFAAHLTHTVHGYAADNTEATPSLAELRAATVESDRWYLDYVARVSRKDLSEIISFTFTDGDEGRMSREEMLMHVALHPGFHRAEVDRILWQLSITPPWDTMAVYLHQIGPARRVRHSATA
jgi:uncharacterized damage-inducible protein DinB